MISGSFHPIAQEWRYYSREKSLIHTLHVAELPDSVSGDTIEIAATSPSTNNGPGGGGHFSVPPLDLGGPPSRTLSVTFSQKTLPQVFGSVGPNKTILAQKNVIIQFAGWSPQIREFYMTPNQAGWYLFYVEGQGDFRDINYIGPPDPNTGVPSSNVSCRIPGVVTTIAGITMAGFFNANNWNNDRFLSYKSSTYSHAISVVGRNQTVIFRGITLGNAPDAQLTGYMFKIAEL